MKTKEPIINPYLFMLLRSLIRYQYTGSMHINLKADNIADIVALGNGKDITFSENTLQKWFSNSEKIHVRLQRRSKDLLCYLLPASYNYPKWSVFEQQECGSEAYSIGWNDVSGTYIAYANLSAADKKRLMTAVEWRVMQLTQAELLLKSTPAAYAHPTRDAALDYLQLATLELADALVRKASETFSAKYTTIDENQKRQYAWRLLHQTIADHKLTSIYEVQRHISDDDWQKINHIVLITNEIYTQYIEGKIAPRYLNYALKAFLQVWHIKVFDKYIPNPAASYWRFARDMQRLPEIYGDIGNVVF